MSWQGTRGATGAHLCDCSINEANSLLGVLELDGAKGFSGKEVSIEHHEASGSHTWLST